MPVDNETKIVSSIAIKQGKLGAAMHNAAYESLGVNFLYLPLTVEDCKNAIAGIKALNFRGTAVSMPHKQEVMQYLDKIASTAEKIGAVNTVSNDDGVLTGYNSDWIGAMEALKEKTELKGKKVVLLGAGGTARAVAFGLKENQCQVTIFNRTPEKAKELAEEFGLEFGGGLEEIKNVEDYDILVNTTSVGFGSEASIVDETGLKEGKVVMDVVFNPVETPLLKKAKNTVLDGNLVELFAMVVAGDDIKRQLLTGAQTILVVDSDAEQSAILDLQLTSRGFRVLTVRTAEAAVKTLIDTGASMVLSEVDLEPVDGFKLKERLNQDERTMSIPLVYFTSRTGSQDVERGFSLGAQDYLLKPLTVEVLVAKIKKYLTEQSGGDASGVTGSLKEMSLPDLVQILSHGRKTGRLKLTMGQHKGEIHFVDGEIYNALFDQQRGEEAFFHMLRYREGTFILDPTFRAESRVIEMTAEMLLLEGMRRFDEDTR